MQLKMDDSDFSITELDDLSDDDSSCTESSGDEDDCSESSGGDRGNVEETLATATSAMQIASAVNILKKQPEPQGHNNISTNQGILSTKIPTAIETTSVFVKAAQAKTIKDISGTPEESQSPVTPKKNGTSPRRANRRRTGRTDSRRGGTNMSRSNSCTRLPAAPLVTGEDGHSSDKSSSTKQLLSQRQRSRSLGPGGGGLMVTARDKNPLTGQNIRGRDLHHQMNAKNADWATNNPLAKADLHAMLHDNNSEDSAGPAILGASRSSSARNLTQYLKAKTAGKTPGAAAPGITLHRANGSQLTAANGGVGPDAQRRKSSNDLMALLGKAKANDKKNSSNDLLAIMVGKAKKQNDKNRPASSNDLLAMLGKAKRNDKNGAVGNNGNATFNTDKRRQGGKDVSSMLDLKKFNLSDSRRALLG